MIATPTVRTFWIEAEENDRIEDASVDEWWERERE
jgi:hypothetical protein